MVILKVMAKVTSPLFSVAAHGTVGKVVTYSQRKKYNQARYQRKQHVHSSEILLIQRDKFYVSGILWKFMTQIERDYWTKIANTGSVDTTIYPTEHIVIT